MFQAFGFRVNIRMKTAFIVKSKCGNSISHKNYSKLFDAQTRHLKDFMLFKQMRKKTIRYETL